MTLDPRWDPAALEDLQDGHRWYEEREPGLGRELAVEIDKAINQAMHHPFLLKKHEHPNLPTTPEVRKFQLDRFDEYGLVYAVVGEAFWIVAVAHAKRKPGYWMDRLKKLT